MEGIATVQEGLGSTLEVSVGAVGVPHGRCSTEGAGVPRNVDLREYLSEEVQAAHAHTTYDLIANIVHDGKPSEGSYRIHVLHHVSVPSSGDLGARGDPPESPRPLPGSGRAQGSGMSCRTCR